VIDNLPDSLSAERKNVVKKACSLVGKLTYFWGGKSSAIGWDSEWGKMKLVTSEGSRSTGCMRPFGLDCSGFVTWTFHNAGFSESAIGHGTSTQVSKGTRISLSSAQPGDLAFYNDTSHVGIVGGKDASGNVLVIHCSSGYNNVVVTTGGFGFAVRPNCY
ncbi:MAG: C40 family peptidase, partial [Clostridia bacterium]|nr:C40 family peptidase [Clostridia bacterium]